MVFLVITVCSNFCFFLVRIVWRRVVAVYLSTSVVLAVSGDRDPFPVLPLGDIRNCGGGGGGQQQNQFEKKKVFRGARKSSMEDKKMTA